MQGADPFLLSVRYGTVAVFLTLQMMIDRAVSTPDELRIDARNSLRLAEIAPNAREKARLLKAANEFLNNAAEIEAGMVVSPQHKHLEKKREARLSTA